MWFGGRVVIVAVGVGRLGHPNVYFLRSDLVGGPWCAKDGAFESSCGKDGGRSIWLLDLGIVCEENV